CRFYIPLRVSRDFCPDFGVLDKQFRSGQDIKVAEYAAICSPSSHLLAQRDGGFWRELIIDRNSDRIFTPCLDDVRGDGEDERGIPSDMAPYEVTVDENLTLIIDAVRHEGKGIFIEHLRFYVEGALE